MVEILDLKTVFLAFGDYSIYMGSKSEDVIAFEGIKVLKKKIKLLSTDSYKKSKSKDSNPNRFTLLCQFENSKIYIILIAMTEHLYFNSAYRILKVFYSDSQLDAIQQLHEMNMKQQEIG